MKNACMRYAPVGIDSVQASAFSQSSAIWSDGMTNELTFNATKLIAKPRSPPGPPTLNMPFEKPVLVSRPTTMEVQVPRPRARPRALVD